LSCQKIFSEGAKPAVEVGVQHINGIGKMGNKFLMDPGFMIQLLQQLLCSGQRLVRHSAYKQRVVSESTLSNRKYYIS
jgi:hypothetical protein